jgi:DNA-binding NarL/FixJ family response regulator
MNASTRIRVLLADDQALVRAGFRMILESEDDIIVTGEAADGRRAIDLTRQTRPDVVLLDIEMPVMTGLEALPSLLASRVIVLTTFERDEYVFEAIRLGASGFLLKNAPPEELVHAVRAVASGGALLAPSVTRRVIEEFAPPRTNSEQRASLAALTDREREVLGCVAEGASNAEIAAALVLSEETIKSHVSSILGKLGVRDRVQAVVFAYEAGVVRPGHQSPDRS